MKGDKTDSLVLKQNGKGNFASVSLPFIEEDFLLNNECARILYHEYAKDLPVIDYHNHLSPKQIAEDHVFDNLTEIWLDGDHYKWRAMRANGVDEKYITGNASAYEKFLKWAETVPYTLRNPLYHWTHLELSQAFGIKKLLKPDAAEEIYHDASRKLQDELSVCTILNNYNVETLCTTDDPVDDLVYHQQIQKKGDITVYPAFRPDRAMNATNIQALNDYLDKLEVVSKTTINSFERLLQALQIRHDFFAENGCRISDHGLETFYDVDFTPKVLEAIFQKIRSGKTLTEEERQQYESGILYELALMDHAKGWVQQFHIGALRNNNKRMLNELGPDTGFDSIGDWQIAQPLAKFLSKLDEDDKLTKTIIYNLNPADNDMIATMVGNFNDGSYPGKVQWGAAWWFLDQKDGIESHLNTLSNMGLISRFVGMLTDSRSFLSYSRHDYFRRILCNTFGEDMEKGLIPKDIKWTGKIIRDICYYNAKNYFNF